MANHCEDCGKLLKAGKLCCACRTYRQKHPEGLYPKYNEGIHYATNNDVICNECGRAFRKLGNHIAFFHHMTIRDYKDKYNILYVEKLTNPDYQTTMRTYNTKYYKKVVGKNLIKHGKKTRYKVGQVVEGRGKHKRKEVSVDVDTK